MADPTALQASALAHVEQFMGAVFEAYQNGRTEAISALSNPALRAFGTAGHEKAYSMTEFARFLPAAPEDFFEAATCRFITAEAFVEGPMAWVWGDLSIRFKAGGAWMDLPPLRGTWILRPSHPAGLSQAPWEVVHFHVSVPDQQQPDQLFSTDEFQAHTAMLAQKVSERTAELEQALEEVRRTQAQLVQQEKLASLGALTAGIAHEIKNPLNFVNNFAQLSAELVREIQDERASTPELRVADVEDVLDDLAANVARIEEHGRRADNIVRSMLAHSRGGRGTSEAMDVNRIVDEYAGLAFHGARAQQPDLAATVERALAPDAGLVDVVPEDLGRVLLNLVSNALYAAHARHRSGTAPDGYTPTVRVLTQSEGRSVRIDVWDNGGGIPESVRARIFEPFFTTKPAGEGTGLGLSLSHDIVAAHGGTLTVQTGDGETTFTITLPAAHPADSMP